MYSHYISYTKVARKKMFNQLYTLFTRKVELDGFKLKVLVITAEWKSRLRTRKIEDNARTSPEIWKTVNYSTKG